MRKPVYLLVACAAILPTLFAALGPRGDDPYPLPKPAEAKAEPDEEAKQALARRLCQAIDQGDRVAVEAALAAGASVELGMGAGEDSTAGRTPLIHAVVADEAELVELLVARGARLENGDDLGHTPLMYAAITKNSGIGGLLVQLGARIDAKDEEERVVLEFLEDEDPIAKGLAELGGKNHDLLASVERGELAAARKLVEAGASPNANDGKISLLTAAVRAGDVEFVKSVLALGARPDLVLVDGFTSTTPLSVAAGEASLEVLKLLMEGKKPAPFALDDALACAAAREGDDALKRVEILLAAGADPSMDSLFQRPPLAAAARRADLPMMALLLAKGADRNAVDRALVEAAGLEGLEQALAVVKALLAIGADPSKDEFFVNALGVATEYAHVPVLEALFPKANDEALNTAVAHAAREGYVSGLAWLCQHGKGRFDFTFRPGLYPTALGGAVEKGHHECIKLLLAVGADANADSSFDHDSPLVAAVRAKDREAIRLLLAAGADPAKTSDTVFRGEISALSVARELGDEAILALLQGGGGEPEQDPLGRTLAETELSHEDIGAFHKLRYTTESGGRSQVVYLRKAVESFDSLRVQEAFSLCWESEPAPTQAELLKFFKRSFGIGGLLLERPGERQQRWRVRFRISIPCDATPERLAQMLDLIAVTGDELEREFAPNAEDRL